MRRDLRVDFFRGIALLTILWNHLVIFSRNTGPFFFKLTPTGLGLSGGAEIFVFLSGFVYGIVYERVLSNRGFLLSYAKSVDRAWQLYVANVVTLIVALGVCAFFSLFTDVDPGAVFASIGLLFDITPDLIWELATLQFFPLYFGILPLYIKLLVIAPVLFWVMRRNVAGGLFLSLGLYIAAQFGLAFGPANFNAFAWQLLFVAGIALGWRQPSFPRSKTGVAIVALLLGLIAARVWLMPRLIQRGFLSPESVFAFPVPLTGKTTLEAARLVHFFLVLYLVSALTRSKSPFWKSSWARPVVVMGQHSLEVFCFGIVLTFTGILTTRTLESTPFDNWPSTFAIMAFACLASVGFAYFIRWRKRAPWKLRKQSRKGSPAATKIGSHAVKGAIVSRNQPEEPQRVSL